MGGPISSGWVHLDHIHESTKITAQHILLLLQYKASNMLPFNDIVLRIKPWVSITLRTWGCLLGRLAGILKNGLVVVINSCFWFKQTVGFHSAILLLELRAGWLNFRWHLNKRLRGFICPIYLIIDINTMLKSFVTYYLEKSIQLPIPNPFYQTPPKLWVSIMHKW